MKSIKLAPKNPYQSHKPPLQKPVSPVIAVSNLSLHKRHRLSICLAILVPRHLCIPFGIKNANRGAGEHIGIVIQSKKAFYQHIVSTGYLFNAEVAKQRNL